MPSSALERLKGRERPLSDLIYVRPPGNRRVYVGLIGGGYVRMKLDQCRQLAVELLALVGGVPTDQALVVCARCGAGSGPVARFCHECGAELGAGEVRGSIDVAP